EALRVSTRGFGTFGMPGAPGFPPRISVLPPRSQKTHNPRTPASTLGYSLTPASSPPRRLFSPFVSRSTRSTMLCFGAWRAAPLAMLEEPQAVWVSPCWNGKSTVGWLLTAAGALFIFSGVLENMQVYFRPTSLFN